jgi:hypothetical protein
VSGNDDCECSRGYTAGDILGSCLPVCIEGCAVDACDRPFSWKACEECAEGWKEVRRYENGGVYCEKACPSGTFDRNGFCEPIEDKDPDEPWDRNAAIVSYTFDKVKDEYDNEGYGGSQHVAALSPEGKSAVPAKDRGLYFDGSSDGYIELQELVFNNSFSMYSWVYVEGADDIHGFLHKPGTVKLVFDLNGQMRMTFEGPGDAATGTDRRL